MVLDEPHFHNNLVPIDEIFSSKGKIKILMVLAKEGESYTSEIAKLTGLNQSCCSSHLKHLAGGNVIQEKIFGRIRIYRFKSEEVKCKAIQNVFELWESNNHDNLPPLETILSSKGKTKIMLVLAKEGELNISEITKQTNLHHKSCSDHLKELTKGHVLQEKIFGRIRIYRIRIEEVKIRALKNLFDLLDSNELENR